MDSVEEPARWVCHLECFFGDEQPGFGSGFLVNIPDSSKFCIFTAGHNIIDEGGQRVTKIKVTFPNKLTFEASSDECFVSKTYGEHPTRQSSAPSSVADYGLIAVDRSECLPDPGGAAFNILLTQIELYQIAISIHGYKEGDEQQSKRTSRPSRIDSEAIYYENFTTAGVSGGPVFANLHGVYTAIGIHNYARRATRLTCGVMSEILSWVSDYRFQRSVENGQSPGIYIQATNGASPKLVAQPGTASSTYLNFLMVDAPKRGEPGKPRFVVLPGHLRPTKDRALKFLTISSEERSTQGLSFSDKDGDWASKRVAIDPKGKKAVLWFPASKAQLAIKPMDRTSNYECKCITQAQDVDAQNSGTRFIISNVDKPDDPLYSHDKGDHIPIPDQLGRSALYIAVCNRDIAAVEKALQDTEPNTACKCGTSAVSKAAENRDVLILDLLLRKGARIGTKNADGETPEEIARRNGHVTGSTNVLSRFSVARKRNVNRYIEAAKTGATAEMGKLLEDGVSIDARDEYGNSALDWAALRQQVDVAQSLLHDFKADPNIQDRKKRTALHRAAEVGCAAVVKLLLQYGAKINFQNKDKMTPLHISAMKGYTDVINALNSGSEKLDLDTRGPNETTPLMLAAAHGQRSVVQLLIDLGADLELEDIKGNTARDRAEDEDHDDIADML